jgi:hypothetical protein
MPWLPKQVGDGQEQPVLVDAEVQVQILPPLPFESPVESGALPLEPQVRRGFLPTPCTQATSRR